MPSGSPDWSGSANLTLRLVDGGEGVGVGVGEGVCLEEEDGVRPEGVWQDGDCSWERLA